MGERSSSAEILCSEAPSAAIRFREASSSGVHFLIVLMLYDFDGFYFVYVETMKRENNMSVFTVFLYSS